MHKKSRNDEAETPVIEGVTTMHECIVTQVHENVEADQKTKSKGFPDAADKSQVRFIPAMAALDPLCEPSTTKKWNTKVHVAATPEPNVGA